MDFYYSNSNDSNISPINAQNYISRGNRYFDPYASSSDNSTNSSSSNNNILSPLSRYLRSGSPVPFTSLSRSPLASIENNIEVFRTPVKVEEDDVVVMDGILVEKKYGGVRGKLTSSDSGGRSSSSETCRWWEDTGTCRFGSKCRFVHGKEDLRPTAFANRNQSEVLTIEPNALLSRSCSYGPRGRSVHHQVHSTASSTESAAMATPTTTVNKLAVSNKDKEPSSSESSTTSASTIAISGTDWCPLDDNIEVTLPPSGENCASREDVNAHVQTVLYGPSGKKRLPVFVDFVETDNSQ
ncbi:uncharacterized protein LOC132606402 isoform X1 [Lycium barbarum]|uniref:uncharacterized protein LOC132606402 isoform X1 n=1 Tax=Lycium barbarum TaxID=112863 RepID=UPI00293E488C|nr:uncharacterized protein LOC132606402 isoform X1 [Lycium barbarum]XP_060175862.1 uncharacterized protein LOC132606402 isoform X1 [Lycium barbarum]XP_060175863.1 uncharacterized protein LOC132606402 isoform X1 [Lycium barbarum]